MKMVAHPLLKKVNLLIRPAADGGDEVVLSQALVQHLRESVAWNPAKNIYMMKSPLLAHHLLGIEWLPVRLASEEECWAVHDENIIQLRGCTPLHQSDLGVPSDVVPGKRVVLH